MPELGCIRADGARSLVVLIRQLNALFGSNVEMDVSTIEPDSRITLLDLESVVEIFNCRLEVFQKVVGKPSVIEVHRVRLVDLILNAVLVATEIDCFVETLNRSIKVPPFEVGHAQAVIKRRTARVLGKRHFQIIC